MTGRIGSNRVRAWVTMAVLATSSVGVAAGSGIDEPVTLRERAEVGQRTKVEVTFRASGTIRPAETADGGDDGPRVDANGKPRPKPAPLAVQVRTELGLIERILECDDAGRPIRSARWATRADASVGGEIRSSTPALRKELSSQVAEFDRATGAVEVWSPAGPLTRSELDLVQAIGDPLTLADLLPEGPVGVGSGYSVRDAGARAVSDYEALAVNGLKGKVKSLDAETATITLSGEVRGAARGGEGTVTCTGTLVFDRATQRVTKLDLERSETRGAGPVEAALQFRSRLVVERTTDPSPPPEALSDRAVQAIPTRMPVGADWLVYTAPDQKYLFRHDRRWHLFWEDTRMVVMKRLDQGILEAQVNFAKAPNAGKGRHQSVDQFRDDIRRALGTRFVSLLGQGEIAGDSAGGFRHKIAVRGRAGEVDILWFYYLLASPDGDQMVATFTLGEAQAQGFNDLDEQLIGTLQWLGTTREAGAAGP